MMLCSRGDHSVCQEAQTEKFWAQAMRLVGREGGDGVAQRGRSLISTIALLLLLGHIACTECIICGLLLQVSHVTWSVYRCVFVCICVRVTLMYGAKTAEPIWWVVAQPCCGPFRKLPPSCRDSC